MEPLHPPIEKCMPPPPLTNLCPPPPPLTNLCPPPPLANLCPPPPPPPPLGKFMPPPPPWRSVKKPVCRVNAATRRYFKKQEIALVLLSIPPILTYLKVLLKSVLSTYFRTLEQQYVSYTKIINIQITSHIVHCCIPAYNWGHVYNIV